MFSDKTWKRIGAKSIFGREQSLAKKEKKIKKRLAATIDNTNRTTSEILILHPKISRTVKINLYFKLLPSGDNDDDDDDDDETNLRLIESGSNYDDRMIFVLTKFVRQTETKMVVALSQIRTRQKFKIILAH